MNWTPGPWTFSETTRSGGLNIMANVAGKSICVGWAAYSVGHESEQIANARLMAASPTLYDALAALVAMAQNPPLSPDAWEVSAELKAGLAALAKARGTYPRQVRGTA